MTDLGWIGNGYAPAKPAPGARPPVSPPITPRRNDHFVGRDFEDTTTRPISARPEETKTLTLPSPGLAQRPSPPAFAYGPTNSFFTRIYDAFRLLGAHPEYAKTLTAMWTHRFGTGMLVGFFMVLISGIGTAAATQSMLALTILEFLSQMIQYTVSLHGAHLRDEAEAQARVGTHTEPGNFAKGLLYTSVGDAAIAAGMFALAWNVAYHGLAGPWLFVPLGILRLSQTCLGVYEFTLWNAFKRRLPTPEVTNTSGPGGVPQHYTITSNGINFVMLSIEANVGAALVSIATTGVVFAAQSLIGSALFHPIALLGIAAGGLLASLPKTVFYPYVKAIAAK